MSTLLSFYAGAYGPTLMIDPEELGELLAIQYTFEKLALATLNKIEFCEVVSCRRDGIEALTLRLVQTTQSKALEIKGLGPNGPEFLWSNTQEEWQWCVSLVEGLVAFQKPGHQYLTRAQVDDALVELCFQETL
jgi:hypothetical protein